MGQEILYCVVCQTQLRGADFDKRRAVRADGKGYCLACARKAIPADRLAGLLEPAGPPSSTRLKESPPKPPTRRAAEAAAPSGNRALLVGGAAVLVAIGLAIALLSSRPAAVEPPPPPTRANVPPPKRIVKLAEPPKLLPDAGDVDAELSRLLPKEEFGQALRVIDAARYRSTLPEWTRMVNQRGDGVHTQAERLLKELKAKAVEAKRAGDPELPRKIHERISAWGMPRAIPELEAALAAVSVPEPPKPEPPKPELATGKLLYTERFDAGRGRFEQGEVVEGALSFPPVGVELSVPFPSPIQDSSVLRFRVKAPPEVKLLHVVVWSNTLKKNGWYHVGPFKAGEWQQVEVKASEIKVGYNRDGDSLAGHTGNSLKLQFQGVPPETRVVIDDFQILE
jgi:hypothetical protein